MHLEIDTARMETELLDDTRHTVGVLDAALLNKGFLPGFVSILQMDESLGR